MNCIHLDNFARRVCSWAAGALLLFVASSALAASPGTLVSTNYKLRAPTMGGSGGIDHASTAIIPTVGELHSIGGQSSSPGASTAPISGDVLASGYYPAIRYVPEPARIAMLTAGAVLLARLAARRARRTRRLSG